MFLIIWKKKKDPLEKQHPNFENNGLGLTKSIYNASQRCGFEPRSGHMWDAKFCTGRSGGFSPGTPVFPPPLINDRLDISEIFLKGPLKPNQKIKSIYNAY